MTNEITPGSFMKEIADSLTLAGDEEIVKTVEEVLPFIQRVAEFLEEFELDVDTELWPDYMAEFQKEMEESGVVFEDEEDEKPFTKTITIHAETQEALDEFVEAVQNVAQDFGLDESDEEMPGNYL